VVDPGEASRRQSRTWRSDLLIPSDQDTPVGRSGSQVLNDRPITQARS
jgi:hypothetical protein